MNVYLEDSWQESRVTVDVIGSEEKELWKETCDFNLHGGERERGGGTVLGLMRAQKAKLNVSAWMEDLICLIGCFSSVKSNRCGSAAWL